MTDPEVCEVCKFNKVDHDILDAFRCAACFWAEMFEDLSDDDLREIADGDAPESYADDQVAAERELALRVARRRAVN